MKKIIISLTLSIFCLTNHLSSQWTQMIWNNGNMKVQSFAVNGNKIFAGEYGVYLSTNEGVNWIGVSNGLVLGGGAYVYSLASSGQNTFAGIDRVYISTNFGASWTPVTNGIPNVQHLYITSLAINGNNVFAGTYVYLGAGIGIFLSTDNGSSWTAINNGLPAGSNISSIAFNGTNIFIGTYASGIYKSTDNGNSWNAFNNGITPNSHISSIAIAGNRLFTSSYNGAIYSSTDNGNTWENTNNGFAPSLIYTLSSSGTTIFVGTEGMGIFKSTNSGGAWYGIGAGILPLGGDTNAAGIHAIICDNTYAFCAPEYGNNGRGIFKRPLSEITGINILGTEIPDNYSLLQNYPNPFNPSTKIKFDIAADGKGQKADVKLIIYNIQGKEITILVNQQLQSGTYDFEWDGSNYPSGMYFYTLRSGDFTETKRMVLLK